MECEICGKKVQPGNNLKQHMLMHVLKNETK